MIQRLRRQQGSIFADQLSGEEDAMQKMSIRKAGTIRLTSPAYYGGCCGSIN
jgi:hypothetical protein